MEEGNQYRPSVAVAPDGSFAVGFQNSDLDQMEFDLFMGVFDPQGELLSEYSLNTYTQDAQREVSLAAVGSLGYAAVWTSRGQDGDGDGVYCRRFFGPGSTDAEEFSLPLSPEQWQSNPSIGANDEMMVVVWQQTSLTGDFELRARVMPLPSY